MFGTFSLTAGNKLIDFDTFQPKALTKVKKLLCGTANETIDVDVLEAYLLAHQENPNRVRVVLEELAQGWWCWRW